MSDTPPDPYRVPPPPDAPAPKAEVKEPAKPEQDPQPAAKPKAKRPKKEQERCNIGHREAFAYYVAMPPKTTLAVFRSHLLAQGFHASIATIGVWCRKYKWVRRREQAWEAKNPVQIEAATDQLAQLGSAKDISVFDGLLIKQANQISRSLEEDGGVSAMDVGVMISNLESLVKVRGMVRVAQIDENAAQERAKPQSDGDEGEADNKEAPAARTDIPNIGEFRKNIIKGGKGG